MTNENPALGYGDVDAQPDIDGADRTPMPEDAAEKEKAARPPHGADSGKAGGQKGGAHDRPNFSQPSNGTDAERSAPGIATDKKSDDTK